MRLVLKLPDGTQREEIVERLPAINNIFNKAKSEPAEEKKDDKRYFEPHHLAPMALMEDLLDNIGKESLKKIESKVLKVLKLPEIDKSQYVSLNKSLGDNFKYAFKKEYNITLSDNFDKKTAEILYKSLKEIPKQFITNKVESVVLDERMGRSKRYYPNHGKYIEADKKIMLNPDIFDIKARYNDGQGHSISKITQVVIHEISHGVDDRNGFSESDEWRSISGWKYIGMVEEPPKGYNRLVIKEEGSATLTSPWGFKKDVNFVRWYATRNPKEDFAESFCFAVTGLIGRFHGTSGKQKLDFIKTNILDNKELVKANTISGVIRGMPSPSQAAKMPTPKTPMPKLSTSASHGQRGAKRGGEWGKHKYLWREGDPGNYVYHYTDEQGKIVSSKEPLHTDLNKQGLYEHLDDQMKADIKKLGKIDPDHLQQWENAHRTGKFEGLLGFKKETPLEPISKQKWHIDVKNMFKEKEFLKDFIKEHGTKGNYVEDVVLSGGKNMTLRIQIPDDGKYVLKPKSGLTEQSYRFSIPDGEEIEREILASDLDRIMGFDFVPPTAQAKVTKKIADDHILDYNDVASMQMFIALPFERNDNYKMAAMTDEDVMNAGLFDYITGATDRHVGNIIVDAQTRKGYGIDNGLNFGIAELSSQAFKEIEKRKLGKISPEHMKLLKSALKKKNEIKQSFVDSGITMPENNAKMILHRIRQLIKKKRFPHGVDEMMSWDMSDAFVNIYNNRKHAFEDFHDYDDNLRQNIEEAILEHFSEMPQEYLIKVPDSPHQHINASEIDNDWLDVRIKKMPVDALIKHLPVAGRFEEFKRQLDEEAAADLDDIQNDLIDGKLQRANAKMEGFANNLDYYGINRLFGNGIGAGTILGRIAMARKLAFDKRLGEFKAGLNHYQQYRVNEFLLKGSKEKRIAIGKDIIDNLEPKKQIEFIQEFAGKLDYNLDKFASKEQFWHKFKDEPRFNEWAKKFDAAQGQDAKNELFGKMANELGEKTMKIMLNQGKVNVVKQRKMLHEALKNRFGVVLYTKGGK